MRRQVKPNATLEKYFLTTGRTPKEVRALISTWPAGLPCGQNMG
jgi:hypothetical protein